MEHIVAGVLAVTERAQHRGSRGHHQGLPRQPPAVQCVRRRRNPLCAAKRGGVQGPVELPAGACKAATKPCGLPAPLVDSQADMHMSAITVPLAPPPASAFTRTTKRGSEALLALARCSLPCLRAVTRGRVWYNAMEQSGQVQQSGSGARIVQDQQAHNLAQKNPASSRAERGRQSLLVQMGGCPMPPQEQGSRQQMAGCVSQRPPSMGAAGAQKGRRQGEQGRSRQNPGGAWRPARRRLLEPWRSRATYLPTNLA